MINLLLREAHRKDFCLIIKNIPIYVTVDPVWTLLVNLLVVERRLPPDALFLEFSLIQIIFVNVHEEVDGTKVLNLLL